MLSFVPLLAIWCGFITYFCSLLHQQCILELEIIAVWCEQLLAVSLAAVCVAMEYALLQRYMQHSVWLKPNISGPLSLMTADPHIHFRDLTALTSSTILCLFLA